MNLDLVAFLDRVIDDGIAAARKDYAERASHFTEGAVAGFEACRRLSPFDLASLLSRARRVADTAYCLKTDIARYWRVQCFASEVEWVCNVVSVALHNVGKPVIVLPTARGTMKAAEILGVA